MLKSNVIVVPSIVENESNSLTEAHILGVPTVAAFSGGMTNRIIHKKTGFLYPFNDYTMLANYIMEYLKEIIWIALKKGYLSIKVMWMY